MKKLIVGTLISLFIVSCGDDDDGGKSGCQTCGNAVISVEICDIGDGKVSVEGVEQDLPEGVSFDAFVKQACSAIDL